MPQESAQKQHKCLVNIETSNCHAFRSETFSKFEKTEKG